VTKTLDDVNDINSEIADLVMGVVEDHSNEDSSPSQIATKADKTYHANKATTAECMKTADQVDDCTVHFSDGTQLVQAFSLSADGQTFMSKNS
jgi:hypothetical protein